MNIYISIYPFVRFFTHSHKEMGSSGKCNFLFHIGWVTYVSCQYIHLSLFYYTYGSHYYWHSDSFRVLRFFNFFRGFAFTYFIQIFVCYHLMTYHIEDMFFLLESSTTIFGFMALYFSIGLDSRVLENSSFIGFCYWFLLVLIPFVRFQYSIVFAYFPMNIISYFIMPLFLFYLC